MYRKLLIPVLVLFVLSVACSLSGSQAPTVVPPTKPPVAEAPTTVPPTAVPPTAEPTAMPPTVEPTAEPTAGPTDTAMPTGPEPFTEEFDQVNPSGWKFLYVAGTERANKIYTEDSNLKFEINTKETYAYVYNEGVSYKDVIVTADVESQGADHNAMVLTCRMSDRGWYEFRVTSDSMVYLYRYDQILKDKHQVPYVTLVPQHVVRQINPGWKKNNIALSCIGDEIRMFVNGTELIYNNQVITDDRYKEGYVGVGSMSFTDTKSAVKVNFERVSAELP